MQRLDGLMIVVVGTCHVPHLELRVTIKNKSSTTSLERKYLLVLVLQDTAYRAPSCVEKYLTYLEIDLITVGASQKRRGVLEERRRGFNSIPLDSGALACWQQSSAAAFAAAPGAL